jgi:hypothetical protein
VVLNAAPEKVLKAITDFGAHQLAVEHGSQLPDSKAILFRWKDKLFGKQWIEWRAIPRPAKNKTYLSQTVFFSPRGLPGFLYWYLLYPLHLLRFGTLIDKIARQSEIR